MLSKLLILLLGFRAYSCLGDFCYFKENQPKRSNIALTPKAS